METSLQGTVYDYWIPLGFLDQGDTSFLKPQWQLIEEFPPIRDLFLNTALLFPDLAVNRHIHRWKKCQQILRGFSTAGSHHCPLPALSHWQTVTDALFQAFLATLLLMGEQMVPFNCNISTLLPKPPPSDLQLETRDCWIPLSHTVAFTWNFSSILSVGLFSAEDESSRICH